MKKTYLFGLLLSVALASCSDWLSVRPKTEATRDEFFETEVGFQDALIGLYIQMKSENLYGKAMTMSTLEHIVSFWDCSPNTAEEALGIFDFNHSGAESAFAGIYGKAYRVIAGANSILGEIDARQKVFKQPGMYEIVKGECLAIRAFCHFDMLRLFGPEPSDIPSGNILAYARVFTKEPQLHVSFDTFREYLLKDLEDAATLLAGNEPAWGNSGGNSDPFLQKRPLRLNYYAVKALQARAYLWFGENENAYACAKEVIYAQDESGKSLFRLGNRSDIENQKSPVYVFTAEHIFALSDSKLEDRYTDLFGKGALAKGSSKDPLLNTLYENQSTDIRYLLMWTEVSGDDENLGKTRNILRKYEETKFIPLLRLSEMYFIAIETGPVSEVQSLWEEYKTARNIVLPDIPGDPDAKAKLLLPEYRKEFYGEGQMFFRYKLKNAVADDILWLPQNAVPQYIVPLPKTELIENDETTVQP